MTEKELAKFIRWLKDNTQIPKAGLVCQTVRLKHMAAEGGGTTVDHWDAPWEVHGDVGALARKIIERMESDAENVGDSIVAYQALPYFGTSTQPDGRFAMKVRVSQELSNEETGEAPAEGPTAKGQLQQQMRHNEIMFGKYTQSLEVVMRRLNDTVINQASYIERLEGARVKVIDQQEILMDRQLDRRIKAERELQAQKRIEEGFKLMLMLAPVVINNLQGSKGLPEREDPTVTQLKTWLASLNNEEIQGMQQVLGVKSITLADFASRFKREYVAQQVSDEHRIQRIVTGPTAQIPQSGAPPTPTIAEQAMKDAMASISPHQHEDVQQLRAFFTSLSAEELKKCEQILGADHLGPVAAMAHGSIAYNAEYLRQFFGSIDPAKAGPLQTVLGPKLMTLAGVGMRLRAEHEAAATRQ